MSECDCAIEIESREQSRLLWVLLIINGVMFAVEISIGILAESMGLIADSLDMLADAAGGGSRAVNQAQSIGSLEVGKYADMVVLDKNLFDIEDLDEILEAKVQATIMDGKFRFRDGI